MSKSVTKKTVNAEAPKQKKQQENKKKLTSAPTIIDCDKFDISKFSVEELALNSEFNKKKGGQFITFPRYQYSSTNKTSFTFKTKPVKFTQYGIKKLDDQFVTSDAKRDYMRIPYDASQPACVELFKMFETIDKYFEENKAAVLGPLKGFAKVFKYQPIVRTPQEQDDLEELQEVEDDSKKKGKKNSKSEDKKEEKKERMKYAKIKFATDFNTHELKTYVFSRENGTPELCKEVKTITDLTEYLKWNSVCQFLITASKVWYAKSKDDNGNRKFGITFKCPQMEVIERATGGARQEFTNYAFGDNNNNKEEEEEDDEETNQKNSKNKSDKEEEEDDGSDKEEEKEEDEEIEKEDEDEDEDEDEEDEDEDEEDDEEEEEEEEKKETKKDSSKKSSPQQKKKN